MVDQAGSICFSIEAMKFTLSMLSKGDVPVSLQISTKANQ